MPPSAITVDSAPWEPEIKTSAAAVDATSILVEWAIPERDGGSTIEDYVVQYDTDPDFGAAQSVVSPVISEYQAIVLDADVYSEAQSIRAATRVTNEIQTITTGIEAVDEVMTITTSADEVLAEVQTVTTSAIDFDEVQTVELSATASDEVQIIRTTAVSVPEIQRVTVAVGNEPEVQTLGFWLLNVDTNGVSMDTLDSDLASYVFTSSYLSGLNVYFDADSCGSSEGINFCQLGVDEDMPRVGTIDCGASTTYCRADLSDLYSGGALMSAEDFQAKLNEMTYNGEEFMVDSDGVGVNVTRTREIYSQDDDDGVYHVEYQITFSGRHLRGNVPKLRVSTNDGISPASLSSSFTAIYPSAELSECCDSACSSSCSQSLGALFEDSDAYVASEGNQPDGNFELSYECEVRAGDVVAFVESSSTSVRLTFEPDSLVVYAGDYLRVGAGSIDSYYEIDSVQEQDRNSANVTLASAYSGVTATIMDSEVGVFYSDPTKDDGVSDTCASKRVRETASIPIDSSAATISSSLRALPNVESSSTLLSVTSRVALPANSSFVGYYFDVTFLGQPGDLRPMTCDETLLTSSRENSEDDDGFADWSKSCNVTTIQDGSLIDGEFELRTFWPHEYVGTPSSYNASNLRWSVSAARLEATLEAVMTADGGSPWGLLDVSRSAYTPSADDRWSGGFAWTVTFLSAIGNVPRMRSVDNLTVAYDAALPANLGQSSTGFGAARVEVEDEASGSYDTFGPDNALDSYTFAEDSTGAASDGGQVSGYYGLEFDGTASASNAIPVANSTTREALSANEFKSAFESALFDGADTVDVARSSSPNRAAGYTYTISYRSARVGGDVPLLGTISSTLGGSGAAVTASVESEGGQIQGSFQLRFNGYTTGTLAYDASAVDVESQLNALQSISPSVVTVSRDGPLSIGPAERGGTQVGAYVWSITFASNLWRDPTVTHFETEDYLPGNWIGDEGSWTDKWSTGHSLEWGKNVGNMPSVSCIDDGLYSTNGALPSDACSVVEVVQGTAPVGGYFRVTLDTRGHHIINRRGIFTSGYIRHNAVAGIVESAGDGTSMEEMLENMPNVGDVEVTRSEVNEGGNNGGFTWTITFLRDAGASGAGQWGDCEQRDTVENLCNSPGDVPKFSNFDDSLLLGSCNSADGYSCSRITFLDVSDGKFTSPPGTSEVQHYYVRDPTYIGFGSNESARATDATNEDVAKKSYLIGFGGEYHANCLPYDATADEVRMALRAIGRASTNSATSAALANVTVSRHTSFVDAPNAYFYRVSFLGTANVEAPVDEGGNGLVFNTSASLRDGANAFIKAGCNPFELDQNITAETWIQGRTNPNNCTASGCADGVVQRGNLTRFDVGSDPLGRANLPWNADPEGSSRSVKTWLESSTLARRVVNVTREVYGRHGVVEWKVTFVYNEFEVPPGAGDIELLNVTQQAATDGVVYIPTVVETRKGSEGLSGYFEIDFESPTGPRRLKYNETADRMEKKLEEMLTIGTVHVERHEYPSSSSGGWGDRATDTTFGGLEWRVFFLANPGSYGGHTFPPGAGNVDSITFDASGLVGDGATVENAVLREGSTPFSGSFTLSYAGATTPAMEWQEAPDEIEYSLEELSTIGTLRVSRDDLAAVLIPGVSAYVSRDSDVAHLTYDYDLFGAGGTLESSLEDYLAPGELFRLGGSGALQIGASPSMLDGATGLPSLVAYSNGAPVVSTGTSRLTSALASGQRLRIGGESYTIMRTGGEVQRLYVAADFASSNATKVYRLFTVQSGSSQSTRCLDFHASADEVTNALNELDSFYNGITVTRIGSGVHGDAYLYSIYFGAGSNSNAGDGDVRLLEVDSRECKDNVRSTVGNNTVVTDGSANITGLDIGVNVVVQGGATEVQTINLALDAGWLEGDYFKLRLGKETTNCLEWGATAANVEDALNGLTTLTDRLVDVTVDLRSLVVAGKTIRVSNSSVAWRRDLADGRDRRTHFDGKVFPGDKIRVNGSDAILTIGSISEDGTSLELTRSLVLETQYAVDQAVLYLVDPQSVIVARDGLGNGTSAVTIVQVVADALLVSDESDDPTTGLFKLQLAHDGEVRQTSCIDFAASADEVADAIDALRFDFNNDGLANDEGHVIVTRVGDGTAAFGHGYEYRFEFKGPDNNQHHGFGGAQSTVLGGNAPVIEVVSVGSAEGCQDAHGPEEILTVTATTWHNKTAVKLSGDAALSLSPGDRIRIEGSEDQYQIYTVAATASYRGASWLELGRPFTCESSTVGCGSGRKVRRSDAGAPSFAVRTEVAGHDVWRYTIYFVGQHLSNVDQLEVVNEATGECASSWAHYRGRARDVRVETTTDGGSLEKQKITLSAKDSKPSSGNYFVLFLNHFIRVDAGFGGRCFGWEPTAEYMERRINEVFDITYNLTHDGVNSTNASTSQVRVTRTGFGDSSSKYGYQYQLDFVGDLVFGDYPPVFVLTNKASLDESTAYFNRFHLDGQDDCEFSGEFVHAPMSATYTIEITGVGVVDSNGTVLSNDTYTLTRVVGTSVSTYFERECRTHYTMINLDAGGYDGLEFRFRSAYGHALGDTWVLQLYTCDHKLPVDAMIEVESESEGGLDPYALTLDRGVTLEGLGYTEGFLVPQTFTVREPKTAIQTITVADTVGGGWLRADGSAEPAYKLALDGSWMNASSCIPWDAEDYDVEAELDNLIQQVYGITDGVTVTRREDAVEAPNGYVYTVYFDGFVGVRAAPVISANSSNCTGAAFAENQGEGVTVSVVAQGAGESTTAFTINALPLGNSEDATVAGRYLGPGGASLPVYKLSGAYMTVAFDEALGDLDPMQVDGSSLASGARSFVFDDVVEGNAATNRVIEDLHTGVPYFVRVAARNRLGYSEWSEEIAIGKPAAVPPKIEDVTIETALAKNEVQEIQLAALHRDEIQVIRTTADTIFEVQESNSLGTIWRFCQWRHQRVLP